MAWSKSGRLQRPKAWAATGPYRQLARRLPRCAGSKRRQLALVERRLHHLEAIANSFAPA